ncbi:MULTISPECIES: DUF6335 family protein [unclassified Leptolyngbya]|uniref:DUF6335 family protein n=1 Tax=unclassified Leptolyngbya TaxID=2650499 RepID=UPI001F54C5A8|nr:MULTISPECIES: DUF6335 family protein [unclassified Leptolyngbya]
MDSAKEMTPNAGLDAARRDFEAELDNEDIDALVDPDFTTLPSIEEEVGLEQVDLNEAVIDTLPADDTDDNLDADDDGIVDAADDDEVISDLPQEMTESYGTGLQGQPTDRTGRYSRRGSYLQAEPDYVITGGDVDASFEDAAVMGEEGVGGTVATPDQDIVEDLAAAVGIQTDDRSFLRTNDMLEERDDRRWELDPKSSEDYTDRRERE